MKNPEYLVRFYGKIDYALECLEEQKLALPRVSKFNDPFDPPIYILTDFPEDISNFDEAEKHLRDKLYNFTFIASFSAVLQKNHPKNNLYMWGHYANGHRGVAIEFNIAFLKKSISPSDTENSKIYPIKYGCHPKANKNDLIELGKNNLTPYMEKFNQALFYKTPNWKPENEWRFLFKSDQTDLDVLKIPILKETISKIYVGLRCSNDEIDKIIRQKNRHFPDAEIYRAKKPKGRIALEFEKI